MRVLIAGDFVPRNRLAPLVDNKDYKSFFSEVKEVVGSVDYALLNFESPVAGEDDKPISKCGPNLKCSAGAVEAVKYAGFDEPLTDIMFNVPNGFTPQTVNTFIPQQRANQ